MIAPSTTQTEQQMNHNQLLEHTSRPGGCGRYALPDAGRELRNAVWCMIVFMSTPPPTWPFPTYKGQPLPKPKPQPKPAYPIEEPALF
jgi:hypothetical protein